MERYNGWKNYETWNLNLWLANDRGSYEYYREIAKNLSGDRDDRAYELAEIIRTEVEEALPVVTGFYADMLTNAICKIDFYEIAESWIDEVDEG